MPSYHIKKVIKDTSVKCAVAELFQDHSFQE